MDKEFVTDYYVQKIDLMIEEAKNRGYYLYAHELLIEKFETLLKLRAN